MQNLNINGGEPFLKDVREELHIKSCSVVTSGSKVTEKWLDEYGRPHRYLMQLV